MTLMRETYSKELDASLEASYNHKPVVIISKSYDSNLSWIRLKENGLK